MADPLQPGTVVERYVIRQVVGGGGFGRVYRAEHRSLGRVVALKEMLEEHVPPADLGRAVQSFEREARLLASLTRDEAARRYLPQVYDHFEAGGRWFLVMEFVEGETLQRRLQRAGRGLPWREVTAWGQQICEALAYLHSQDPPVLFRDLKPSNVMVADADGRIRLIDFGIARPFRPGGAPDSRPLGSPGYCAPEQMTGRTSPRSDLYALGATLHHLLTGHSPEEMQHAFAFVSPSQLARASGLPPVPEAVAQVVMRCLAVREEDRYASAAEVAQALAEAAAAPVPPLTEEQGATTDLRGRIDAVPPPPQASPRPVARSPEAEPLPPTHSGEGPAPAPPAASDGQPGVAGGRLSFRPRGSTAALLIGVAVVAVMGVWLRARQVPPQPPRSPTPPVTHQRPAAAPRAPTPRPVPKRNAGRPARPRPASATVRVRICLASGRRARNRCPRTEVRSYTVGKAPRSACTLHRAPPTVRVRVCRTTGRRASPHCPTTRVAVFARGHVPAMCRAHRPATARRQARPACKRYCRRCGSPASAQARFCRQCGSPIGD